jgi:ubiquinone/menaquinone biosynthesis C-methylase UbiE
MSLLRHKQDWDELGKMDPFWAILSDPSKKYGQWDPEAFFRTGEEEVRKVLERADRLGYPREKRRLLDFGCGVGRLTRAFLTSFQECYGVDISESMIRKAKELNREFPNCHFILNVESHLGLFPDAYFDMIYTNIVLQHLSDNSTVKAYLAEFARVLRKGGLIAFQLPTNIPLKNRLQPQRRLYGLLRGFGFRETFL